MPEKNEQRLLALVEAVGDALLARGWSLSVAESCTGGLVGHLLTNVAGSSRYFAGGVISYSNEIKARLLGVSRETLNRYGAVSPQTAAEMATGARQALHTGVAVSVTGIAGPGGGTPEKPVGLVYLHLSAPDVEMGERLQWTGTRIENKWHSAEAALQLLLRYLQTI